MIQKLIELLSTMHPVNVAIAFCLYTNTPESVLELTNNSPDPSPDWVRILAAGADPSIIDLALYDLFTDPVWASFLDPQ